MTKNNRTAIMARIHIAKKELALDDDAYRAMLNAATGCSSCKDMHISDLYKVMEHLKQRGYKPTVKKFGKRPNPSQSNKALISKVEALLADRGLHWNYAHAMAQRMFKIEKVDWLKPDQIRGIISALTRQVKNKEN